MFPKGTVTKAVTPAEKPPAVTGQKETTVVYMVNNTDSQVDAGNEPYWRIQRARICACAVVLMTLIVVAGTLGGIAIVLTITSGVATTDPTPGLNHAGREPLLGNEVPLPKLPESTIRIKIDNGGLLPPKESAIPIKIDNGGLLPPTEPATPDPIVIDDGGLLPPKEPATPDPIVIDDGGLLPPKEPATPELTAIDGVTDDVAIELSPSISLSSSDEDSQSSSVKSYHRGRNYISSSFPYDGWYAHGQEGSPPWERSDWIGPSERPSDETDVEVSGDDQESDYDGSAEPDSIVIDDGGLLPPTEPATPDPIVIDDGGLLPPKEPATPELTAIDGVTDDVAIELSPSISLSSSDEDSQSSSVKSYHRGKNYISSSFPYDGWYAHGQEGSPPWERSDWIGPSERPSDETDVEVSGDDQENGSGEPDLPMDVVDSSTPSPDDTGLSYPPSSISSNAYEWRSRASDGIVTDSSLDWMDDVSFYSSL